jgi:hypothetical protein
MTRRVRDVADTRPGYRKGAHGLSVRVALLALVPILRVSAAPPNDAFAGAIPFEGPFGALSGTNVGATREAAEPRIDGYEGGRSVWWRWTAPDRGHMTLSTSGSNFDTILGVYTGTAVGSLELVAENDDDDAGLHSVVDFGAVAGTTYHIAVDGVNGEFGADDGNIVLNWFVSSGDGPSNDHFADRIRLEGSEGKVQGSSIGATREAGEPDHAEGDGTKSVWWSWMAPGPGTLALDTSGSTFDTLLAVYTGASLESLNLVTENDDNEAADDFSSAVLFRASGGTEYQIAVDGFEEESGTVTLSWSFSPLARNPTFIRGDCDGNAAVNITDAVCTLDWLFQGGAEPECIAATNVNGLHLVDLGDAVHLLLYLFQGGPAPVAPFPDCGPGTLASDEEGCWAPPSVCR